MTKFKKILKNAFTGLILKKPAKKVFNKLSGRDKIKKIAEQQKEQKTSELNVRKTQACSAVNQHYQQCLADIAVNKQQLSEIQNILSADKQEIVNHINQAKDGVLLQNSRLLQEHYNQIVNLLDRHAMEIEEQYVMSIREIEAAIFAFSEQQTEMAVHQVQTEQQISIISQQLSEQLDCLASGLAEKYDRLLSNNNEELNNVAHQEAALETEYSRELSNIQKQYNDALNNVVQQIDSWKQQASKKAAKTFVIQTASGILANCIAPGISASFQVCSKAGMAAIKAATFSTINNIATGQLKTLPTSILKNVATSIVNPLVSANIVDPLNISNAALRAGISGGISTGILAKCAHQKMLAGMAQGAVQAYAGQLLEDIITAQETVEENYVKQAETDKSSSTQVLPAQNSQNTIATQENQQPVEVIEAQQESSLGLFEYDKEPLPAPTREELFPTKPPKSSFSKSLQQKSADSSLKFMERNNSFQPITAHQGKILDFVEQKARGQSVLSSSAENQQNYAIDVVRKNYSQDTSIGITPFLSLKTTNVAFLPGVTQAATETKVEAGINLAQRNGDRFKVGVDLGRVDVLAGAEMTAAAKLNGSVHPKMSSYVSVKASAIAATAEIGPVKIPFSGVECTSSLQAGLLNYDSTSIAQASLTKVSLSTTCTNIITEDLRSSHVKAGLRP